MRPVTLLPLFVISACAQSIPVLSQPQIEQLEMTVARNPTDLQSQTLLGENYAFTILGVTSLGQYNTVAGVDPSKEDGDFAQHARDVMQNSTLPGLLAEGGIALWNFSFFVQGYETSQPAGPQTDYLDARALGAQALDRAITIDPGDPEWRYYRIPVTIFRADFDFMPLSAADAYRQVKQDLSLLSGSTLDAMLAGAAKLAVKASALDDARSYAIELLESATDPQDWNYGNAIFFGNMVLGQVALRRGDVDGAISLLLASGKTPGSASLDSFGPNMSLARDLLTYPAGIRSARLPHRAPRPPRMPTASGDVREAVVQFFDLCKIFWTMDNGLLQQWSQQVQAGTVPDFGSNLYY